MQSENAIAIVHMMAKYAVCKNYTCMLFGTDVGCVEVWYATSGIYREAMR